jgi:hypothetical protein
MNASNSPGQLFFTLLCTLLLTATSLNAQIVLDGYLDDWKPEHVVATDPSGDATGRFDLSSVSAQVFGGKVFLRFDTGAELNLQSGKPDDGNLVLKVTLPRNRELEIDFRGRAAVLTAEGGASTIPWDELDFIALPTFATRDFELQFDLNQFGLAAGDELTLNFEGSDSLAAPIKLQLNSQSLPSFAPLQTEKQQSAIRVASINTLQSGLADPKRAPTIRGMLDFAAADIYCFNEERDATAFRQVATAWWATGHDVQPTIIHKGSNAIVTGHPAKELTTEMDRVAVALVEPPAEPPVVVFSVHFKCCGYAGSDEDQQRRAQAADVATTIKQIRSGEYGELAKTARIVVLGDYNLVGSREPLETILAADLEELTLRSVLDGSTATWRGVTKKETFWPGRLDFVAADAGSGKANGFLVRCSDIGKLAGMENADPLATDHAMLVLDCQRVPSPVPTEPKIPRDSGSNPGLPRPMANRIHPAAATRQPRQANPERLRGRFRGTLGRPARQLNL